MGALSPSDHPQSCPELRPSCAERLQVPRAVSTVTCKEDFKVTNVSARMDGTA